MQMFHYLSYGLVAILVFVGGKMMIMDFYKLPIGISLGVVAGILATAVIVSLLRPRRNAGAVQAQTRALQISQEEVLR